MRWIILICALLCCYSCQEEARGATILEAEEPLLGAHEIPGMSHDDFIALLNQVWQKSQRRDNGRNGKIPTPLTPQSGFVP